LNPRKKTAVQIKKHHSISINSKIFIDWNKNCSDQIKNLEVFVNKKILKENGILNFLVLYIKHQKMLRCL
jgi:hypothetical protein